MSALGALRAPLLVLVFAGCAASGRPAMPAPAPGGSGSLPPIPMVVGPLRVTVVYPAATDLIGARDSTFLFGSAGTGEASLTVDGQPVRVWPNGAWLAWVALPPDSVAHFRIAARTATDSVSLIYPVGRVHRFLPPLAPVWIDSASATPAARAWWPADEFLPVSVRAAEGAMVRLILPDGTLVPLAPDVGPGDVPPAIRAFDRDTGNLAVAPRADRYTGALRGRAIGRDPGPVLGDPCCCCPTDSASHHAEAPTPADSAIIIEAVVGPDTVRARWSLRLALLDSLPTVVEFNDDTAGKGDTDSLTIGRARPGATYHWFFPTGTRAVVSGRLGDDLRVRLSREQEAWVPAADAMALPAGTAAVRGTVASITVTPAADRLMIRIPVSQRVPFRVEEGESELTLRLYNTVGDVNWIRYGRSERYLRGIRWLQAAGDEVTITASLRGPVWGYRTRWNRNDLLLEIRLPPPADPRHPLAGRLIVVDPGHPPFGATGPTGLREAEANLAVALQLRDLLQAGGARVVMTRATDQSLDLWPRVRLADSVNADLLISVHNNALPDGVNPFTNSGASVFYNHPRSLALAQAVQRALVRRLGVRDLGAARGDLALVRPTWMPAVLTEGLFMMLPDHEAALRNPLGQRAYALAIRDGVVEFLSDVVAGPGTVVP
jgi:N-acetylmuramoyl-L-alanine amidase